MASSSPLPSFIPPESDKVRVVIMAALKEELSAVKQALQTHRDRTEGRVAWCQIGMGATCVEMAGAFVGRVPETRLILSVGFCGGLEAHLQVGDIVLPGKIVSDDGATDSDAPIEMNEVLVDQTAKALVASGLEVNRGVQVCVEVPVFEAEQKRRLAQLHQAVAVDMETAHLVRVAAESRASFMSLRTVSDGVDSGLPKEIGGFLDEKGKVRAGNILKFALGGRENLKELWRLNKHSKVAAKSLRVALEAAIPAIMGWADCTS